MPDLGLSARPLADTGSRPVRFQVSRTTLYDNDKPPCAEAMKGTTQVWDRRTFKSPEEHDAKLASMRGGPWLSRGTEHGYWERDGERGIQRRLDDRPAWFVEFHSLDELLAFQRKYGDLVLTTSSDGGDILEIEIYDGYRE